MNVLRMFQANSKYKVMKFSTMMWTLVLGFLVFSNQVFADDQTPLKQGEKEEVISEGDQVEAEDSAASSNSMSQNVDSGAVTAQAEEVDLNEDSPSDMTAVSLTKDSSNKKEDTAGFFESLFLSGPTKVDAADDEELDSVTRWRPGNELVSSSAKNYKNANSFSEFPIAKNEMLALRPEKRLQNNVNNINRGPASTFGSKPSMPSTLDLDHDAQVFDISNSFESMYEQKEQLVGRSPASVSTPVARVIAVRRELALNDVDSNRAAKDIVLNGGSGAGLSEGMMLSVFRKIPIIDPYQANQQTDLDVEFAKVKIVHVQSDIAVARVHSIEDIAFGLSVGTRAVLVGDFVKNSR